MAANIIIAMAPPIIIPLFDVRLLTWAGPILLENCLKGLALIVCCIEDGWDG